MRNQKLLTILFVLSAILIFKNFVSSEIDNYYTLQSQIKDARADYDIYQKIENSLISKEIINDAIMNKLEKLKLILPINFNEDFYIESISSLVRSSGLLLESVDINQDSVSSGSELQDIVISLNLSGPYSDFINFLKSIRNNITPLEISEFSIDSSGIVDGANSFKYGVKILTRIAL